MTTPLTGSEPDALREAILRAARLLPQQGPISAFVFLNTLQALEDLPFDEGLRKGARLMGVQPYLAEDRYREMMARGRIGPDDLGHVLRRDLTDRSRSHHAPRDEPRAIDAGSRKAHHAERDGYMDQPDAKLAGVTTPYEVRLAMLLHPLAAGPAEELRWFVSETDALTRFRPDVPTAAREKIVAEARRWTLRDLHDQRLHDDLIRRFGEDSIESWSDATWESFALRLLWRTCRGGSYATSGNLRARRAAVPGVRLRDDFLAATLQDSDELVHGLLIGFCAAFADQGLADWSLPARELGFFRAFQELHELRAGPPDRWLRGLPAEIARMKAAALSPLDSIRESLELLGVTAAERDDFLAASLLALRGWAGLLWQMEDRPDRVAIPAPRGTLIEFLAVRLLLDRLALAHLAGQALNYRGPLAGLRDVLTQRHHSAQGSGSRIRQNAGAAEPTRVLANAATHDPAPGPSVEARALAAFQLAQLLGWSPFDLQRCSPADWSELFAEIESFSEVERRRMFHLAFERRFRRQALDAIALHARRPSTRVVQPRFQAVFCIDTREESFRRHLEEQSPDVETFGTAGFFNVPIYYRGVADAHFSALCPIVVRPKHWVVEEVVHTLEDMDRRRAKTRRAIGTVTHTVHRDSRGITRGAVLTAGLGVLASVPLVARVLFPRTTAHVRRFLGQFVEAPVVTRLQLERTASQPGPEGDQVGFTVDEMANIGERVLRDIGLTSRFAPLVFFFGHGSSCLNNPHKSAYDCGACSGGAGGPNARALAEMLNEPRVRAVLATRGLSIPGGTWFVGGLHNTCRDEVAFYDLDRVPKSHWDAFRAARETLREVCRRNAHERCRRFRSAPLKLSFAAAHEHVEGRSEDLAQPRPEFGNATNALCFVGRRHRLRGLFLDRRCFQQSYDPEQDDERLSILGRILAPVVPVCEGINLQYFLSYVDSAGWGSGTKLPHNVTSLLGVMDGAASDLRTGLPWQGVEIHEPLRLLFIIEATPDGMRQILDRDPHVGRILKNGWSQLALLDPRSDEIRVFRGGEFHRFRPSDIELPRAATSLDWYRGQREHLDFAEIVSNGLLAAPPENAHA